MRAKTSQELKSHELAFCVVIPTHVVATTLVCGYRTHLGVSEQDPEESDFLP